VNCLGDKVPSAVKRVVKKLQAAGFEAYPVGGAVRDLLLGRKVGDWDITTNARPELVAALFERVIPTGIAHGTVTVLSGRRSIEVTTFRSDIGYSDGRHPDRVVFLRSLREDLGRRDFTINAMAYDLERKKLVDPHGGRRDLARRLVRAVGDPDRRFSEDGLRPLRAMRFACVLDFDIDGRTYRAIPGALSVFRNIAPERVRDELLKMLASRQAARGIELLQECGLLDGILPELQATIGFAQNRFHRHDVYRHSLECLRHSRGDAVLKLSVLLHDIGKPETAAGPVGERTFYGHEAASSRLAGCIMRRLKFSNAQIRRVQALIGGHMFHYEEGWTDGAVRRLVSRADPLNLTDLWEMRRADAWGRGMGVRATLANLRALKARVEKVMRADAAFKVTDLAIGGQDVMKILGCRPGPLVGRMLDQLLERVLDDPALNNKKALESQIRSIAGQSLA